MPRERLPMRKIHDVLRLHADGLSKRRIAVGLNIGRTAVGDYLRRARRAGLAWPLPEGLSDEALERLLFAPPAAVSPDRRPHRPRTASRRARPPGRMRSGFAVASSPSIPMPRRARTGQIRSSSVWLSLGDAAAGKRSKIARSAPDLEVFQRRIVQLLPVGQSGDGARFRSGNRWRRG